MKFREVGKGKYEAYRTNVQIQEEEKKPVIKKSTKKAKPKNIEKQSH